MIDMFIDWSKRYNTGHSKIDEEHKELVNILNNLYVSITSGKREEECKAFQDAVKSLLSYVKFHFSYEEGLMERFEYSRRDIHKDKHKKFISMILEEFELYKKEPRFVASQLVRHLRDWLLEHIAVEDKEMVSFFIKVAQNKQCSNKSGDTIKF